MKRILLALAVLAFTATSAPAAPFTGYPTTPPPPAPVQKPYLPPRPVPPAVKPAPAPMHVPGAMHRPAPAPRAGHHQAALHGNVMSKVYHARDCEYYNIKGKVVEFSSPREAERAGFRACKICEGKEGVATQKKMQRKDKMHRHSNLHGNPGTKTLHGPSCKFYNAKSSSERFESLEQARRHGYTLCTLCGGK